MILRNRRGDESTREMRTQVLEVEGDGDRTVIVFNQPRDVKGTAFLSHMHKEGSDDQWLYLPALKRVKRIASNNKAGPFMGSEFAYEDISSQEVEKYTYLYLRDEVLDGQATFVVERDPVDSRSGYSRQVVWYDPGRVPPHQTRVLRSQGNPAQDAHVPRVRAVPGSVLAGTSPGDGEPPDGQEYDAALGRLFVPPRTHGP